MKKSTEKQLPSSLEIPLALLSAALFVPALPPFDLWPLALIAFAPLLLVLRDVTPRRAFLLSWLTGTLINVGGYFWAGELLADFFSLSLIGGLALLVLLSAYQGLVIAVWGGTSKLLAKRAHVPWMLSVPLVIVLAEQVIPILFQHYLGIALWRAWPLIQVAELGGAPAASAMLMLINIVLTDVGLSMWQKRPVPRATRWGTAALMLILTLGLGRATQINSARQRAPQLQVGLLQSNFGVISQEAREHQGADYIQALQDDTLALSEQGADLIIWAESVWPYLFSRELEREFPPGHPWELRPGAEGRLLAGMLSHPFGQGADVYDSAVLFTEAGDVAGLYDKARLIPFLEFVPLERYFPRLAENLKARMPHWRPELTPGEAVAPLVDDNLRIGPMICSEELHMAHAHELARQEINLLVTIGSDAWFPAAASQQHLALAAFRAVETRRDLVRAMNTGVSGIVDATGQVREQGPFYTLPIDEPMDDATLLHGEVALLELTALGPYTIRFFLWPCLLALIIGVHYGQKTKA